MFEQRNDVCSCTEALYARELSHRAANALQQALAAMRLSRSGRIDFDDAMDRLNAMAALHMLLSRQGRTLVDSAERIRETCATIAIAAGAADDLDVITDLDHVLATETALRPVLMIVAELVGNSVRHAFPDGSGTIHVALRDDGILTELVVEDDGVCGGWDRPDGEGCGIVDALAGRAGGQVRRSLTTGGSSRIEVAVPSLAAAAAAPAGCA